MHRIVLYPGRTGRIPPFQKIEFKNVITIYQTLYNTYRRQQNTGNGLKHRGYYLSFGKLLHNNIYTQIIKRH